MAREVEEEAGEGDVDKETHSMMEYLESLGSMTVVVVGEEEVEEEIGARSMDKIT